MATVIEPSSSTMTTLAKLDAFGKHTFKIIEKNDYTFLNFLKFGENMVDEFRGILRMIINANYRAINLIKFNSLLFNMINRSPDMVYNTLYELFEIESELFHTNLQKKFSDKTFIPDIKLFIIEIILF